MSLLQGFGTAPTESMGERVMRLNLDIDRVSGRVVIWWADDENPERHPRIRFVVLESVQESNLRIVL